MKAAAAMVGFSRARAYRLLDGRPVSELLAVDDDGLSVVVGGRAGEEQ